MKTFRDAQGRAALDVNPRGELTAAEELQWLLFLKHMPALVDTLERVLGDITELGRLRPATSERLRLVRREMRP